MGASGQRPPEVVKVPTLRQVLNDLGQALEPGPAGLTFPREDVLPDGGVQFEPILWQLTFLLVKEMAWMLERGGTGGPRIGSE